MTAAESMCPLSTETIARWVRAAESVERLRHQLTRDVAERVGRPVHWRAASEAIADDPVLLHASGPAELVLQTDSPWTPDDETADWLAAASAVTTALQANARQTDRLRVWATTDHLTGALNRRRFYEVTNQILLRAHEEGFRATLLLYDIDDFKHYNDTYGHAVGDEILQDIAALMRQVCREQDVVARIGGDEFAVLFWDPELREPGSRPLTDAQSLADRFCRAVREHRLASLGPNAVGSLTISGGLAVFPEHGRTVRELLAQADAALRAAKATGKNVIQLVGDGDEGCAGT